MRLHMCAIRSHIIVLIISALASHDLASVVYADDVVDTAHFRPKELGFAFIKPRVDESTGFVVGGKNETEAIKRLTSLNGRSISELEQVMRPAAETSADEGSDAGFLGEDERLLDVLVMDNAYVVDELGLNHQDLARPLLIIAHYAMRHANRDGVRIRHGALNLRVSILRTRGYQISPFLDGTKTNTDVTIKNLDDGKELKYSLLVPLMIERYGFYEGRGTPYRVDPKTVVGLFKLRKTN